MAGKIELLVLTESEQVVLDTALEFYVRLGLGQLSEIGLRLRLLTHDREFVPYDRITATLSELERDVWTGTPWRVGDRQAGLHTLIAVLIQARLRGDAREERWARRRVRALRQRDSI